MPATRQPHAPHRPAPRRAFLIATAVGVTQLTVLALIPAGYRPAVSLAFLVTATISLFAVAIHLQHAAAARNDRLIQAYQDARARMKALSRIDVPDSYEAPDITMRAATILAHNGFSATWLADHLDLPPALAELIVEHQHADPSTGDTSANPDPS